MRLPWISRPTIDEFMNALGTLIGQVYGTGGITSSSIVIPPCDLSPVAHEIGISSQRDLRRDEVVLVVQARGAEYTHICREIRIAARSVGTMAILNSSGVDWQIRRAVEQAIAEVSAELVQATGAQRLSRRNIVTRDLFPDLNVARMLRRIVLDYVRAMTDDRIGVEASITGDGSRGAYVVFLEAEAYPPVYGQIVIPNEWVLEGGLERRLYQSVYEITRQWLNHHAERNAVWIDRGNFQSTQEADQRSRELLISALSPAQAEEFKRHNHITVRGEATGDTYIIRPGKSFNVKRSDGVRFCATPGDRFSDYDIMLAQKLWLETNEKEFKRIANTGPVHETYGPRVPIGAHCAQHTRVDAGLWVDAGVVPWDGPTEERITRLPDERIEISLVAVEGPPEPPFTISERFAVVNPAANVIRPEE